MGPHSEDGEGPGKISVQGREEDHQEEAVAEDEWELGLTASGGGTRGSGARGDTEVVSTRSILDLCERATQRPGVRVSRSLWEKAGIDLEGAKKLAADTTTRSEMDS